MGWRPSRTTTQYGTIPAGTDERFLWEFSIRQNGTESEASFRFRAALRMFVYRPRAALFGSGETRGLPSRSSRGIMPQA